MLAISASVSYVLERLTKLGMMKTLRDKYNDFQLWNAFMYCDTDEEYNIVYSELI